MPCWQKVRPKPPEPGDPDYQQFEDECPDAKKRPAPTRKEEKEAVPA